MNGIKKGDRTTAVWQNGGFSAKLKVSAPKSATSPSCKTMIRNPTASEQITPFASRQTSVNLRLSYHRVRLTQFCFRRRLNLRLSNNLLRTPYITRLAKLCSEKKNRGIPK